MSQSGLQNFTDSLLARPGGFNLVQKVKDAVTGIAADIGVPIDRFTARPGELDDDTAVLRYQYSKTYDYYTRDSNGDTEIASIQFRITVYTLTDPSDEFKDYIRDTTHPRLKTLFNTGTYDSYMSGFGFHTEGTQEEDPPQVVGQDEIPPTGLGVPNFSVEAYDPDGNLEGHARGYSLDFGVSPTLVNSTPEAGQEVWRVRSLNKARGDYELGPDANTPARERAKAASGKTTYINGFPAGSITSRGTTWLTKEHARPSAAKYRSRQYITDNSGTPYQALSPGAKLYKVNETTDAVYLSTVEPQNFDPTAPDEIDPTATGIEEVENFLDLDDEPTEFVVTQDDGPSKLGKYTPTVSRAIERKTYFDIISG